ncbi:MAG: radical SAM family heme chaperone HemW [Chloroflexi bacterium]|nr:radical SAM family heme chaperone HemW [Chloroflexota bacterium]
MQARSPVALYVHVPFCLSLCPYCDFVVYTGRDAHGPASMVDAFVRALLVELDLRADALEERFGAARAALTSVYLGGGTPSLLPAAVIRGLLERVDRRFGIASGAEVTMESNPGAGDRGDLAGFRAAGVNRLSLGVQSLDPSELKRLGRRHGPDDVADAMAAARAAGFEDVSLDLLYDIPGQTVGSWEATIEGAIGLVPDHISAYALTLDDPEAESLTGPTGDHLPLRSGARAWRGRARREQDEDMAAELYALAMARLAAAGYVGYELSNWARPGRECRHNLAYWQREPYEAVGPGAHASDGALERRWNAARLEGYLAALLARDGSQAELPPGGRETLDGATARAEGVILGLRMTSGVDEALISDPLLAPGLAWGLQARLLERGSARIRLSESGRLLSNEIFLRLLPDAAPGTSSPVATEAAA